jgi:hypothetical protein
MIVPQVPSTSIPGTLKAFYWLLALRPIGRGREITPPRLDIRHRFLGAEYPALKMMTKYIGTIVSALLLAILGLNLGTAQTHPAPGAHRGAVKKNRPPQPPLFDYRRGTSNWPYGPGYNFPYPDRPYGDPGHGGD